MTTPGFAFYAALAEQVYRRSWVQGAADQPIFISGDGDPRAGNDLDLGVTADAPLVNISAPAQSFGSNVAVLLSKFSFDDNYIYDTATGFVAMVVQQGSQYIVVFRGTDAGNFTPETAIEGVFQAAPAADVDQDDFNADVSLSLGTGLDNSQAQDAINLTKAVIALAGNYGPAPVFPFFDCLCWDLPRSLQANEAVGGLWNERIEQIGKKYGCLAVTAELSGAAPLTAARAWRPPPRHGSP